MLTTAVNIIIFFVLFKFVQNHAHLSGWDPRKHKNWHLINFDDCGVSSDDRIIGGTKASLGQFPWIVRIGMKIDDLPKIYFKCGGVLLNQQYVLTAAHCLSRLTRTMHYKIRVGEYDTKTNIDCEYDSCADKVQDFDIEKIIIHEAYIPQRYLHDIALIRLKGFVNFNDYVSIICLPYGEMIEKSYLGEIAEVAGWGIHNITTEKTSSVLLYVRIPIVNRELCKKAFSSYTRITNQQLCAGSPGLDSCGGDSGGPLMKVDDFDGMPRYYSLGIVSFGSSDCGSEIPGVYTDVRHYLKWILDNIEP